MLQCLTLFRNILNKLLMQIYTLPYADTIPAKEYFEVINSGYLYLEMSSSLDVSGKSWGISGEKLLLGLDLRK